MGEEIKDKIKESTYTKQNSDDGYRRHDGGDLFASSYAQNYSKMVAEGPKSTELPYGVGDQVSHIKFGTGVIKDIARVGKDYGVTVEVPNCGTKKMLSAVANLKKI